MARYVFINKKIKIEREVVYMAWIPQNGIAVHVDDKETNRGYKGWFSYAKGYPELNVIPIRGGVGNTSWDKIGWGFICIDESVLDAAIKMKVLHNYVSGRKTGGRVTNRYYLTNTSCGNGDMFNQRKVKPRYMTIVTHELVNYEPKVFACSIMDWDSQIIRGLQTNSFYLMNTRKNGKFNPGRHVIQAGVDGKTIQMAKVIEQIKRGSQPSYDELEPHHKYALHDQRTKSVDVYTPEQHKTIHKLMGSEGHRFDIHIRTVKELEIYLDFLDTELYKVMFVRDGKQQSI